MPVDIRWLFGEIFLVCLVPGSPITDHRDPGKEVSFYPLLGVGYLREIDKAIDYSSGGMAFYGGFGAKMSLSGRLFVAPEVRLGVHTFPRFTVSVGYGF